MMFVFCIIAFVYICWSINMKNTDPARHEQMRRETAERNQKILKAGGHGVKTLLEIWLKRR